MKQLVLGRIYKIEWVDSLIIDPHKAWKLFSDINWKKIDEDSFIFSVGILIKETDTNIALTQSVRKNNSDYGGSIIVITKKSIISFKTI